MRWVTVLAQVLKDQGVQLAKADQPVLQSRRGQLPTVLVLCLDVVMILNSVVTDEQRPIFPSLVQAPSAASGERQQPHA